jgi:PIN domain nuclease of toxin-antitoxin system
VRWLSDSRKLSREQLRVLEAAVRRAEPLAISCMSLLEIAVLASDNKLRLRGSLAEFLAALEENPVFTILPLTYEIASEVAAIGDSLRDPADRAIVATARVHKLRLITSDQRIIASQLIPTIE